MQELIWLLPTFPLLGFLALVITAGSLPKRAVAFVGAGRWSFFCGRTLYCL